MSQAKTRALEAYLLIGVAAACLFGFSYRCAVRPVAPDTAVVTPAVPADTEAAGTVAHRGTLEAAR